MHCVYELYGFYRRVSGCLCPLSLMLNKKHRWSRKNQRLTTNSSMKWYARYELSYHEHDATLVQHEVHATCQKPVPYPQSFLSWIRFNLE